MGHTDYLHYNTILPEILLRVAILHPDNIQYNPILPEIHFRGAVLNPFFLPIIDFNFLEDLLNFILYDFNNFIYHSNSPNYSSSY